MILSDDCNLFGQQNSFAAPFFATVMPGLLHRYFIVYLCIPVTRLFLNTHSSKCIFRTELSGPVSLKLLHEETLQLLFNLLNDEPVLFDKHGN